MCFKSYEKRIENLEILKTKFRKNRNF